MSIENLPDRGRAKPYAALSAGAFAVAAYLCLMNLDYVGFWSDETFVASIGRNLLEQGSIVGWDGRNLITGPNGNELNKDLYNVFPPLQYVLTAAGFALFGYGETGARVLHVACGLLAPRMFRPCSPPAPAGLPAFAVFSFLLLAAWSAQLLLYFRQARYYAASVLCLAAGFYLYERYWQTRKPLHLAALTLVSALAFFNHYAIGAATMLALAAYHLIFRSRETAIRQWAALRGLRPGGLSRCRLLSRLCRPPGPRPQSWNGCF